MKRLFLSSVLAVMAACVEPPPSTPQPTVDDPGIANPRSEDRSLALGARTQALASDDQPPATTQVAGVWQDQFMDMCRDWFLQYCFADFPAPQCPPAPQGQPCSPVGSFCYKTVTRQMFRYYTCD